MEKTLQKIFYWLQFIDSARFMISSLSNSVNNLSEEIHDIKCKYGHNDKNCETWNWINIVTIFLHTQT